MDINIPALEQLLKMVSSGIGSVAGPLLAPWKARVGAKVARIEAQGQAEALLIQTDSHTKAMELITKAELNAKKILDDVPLQIQSKFELQKEIQSRIKFQEEKRQANIRSIVNIAAEELGDKSVKPCEVDHDWTARFFADAMDVSSIELQKLWGKILAGEVEAAGMTSIKTLSILKQMSQREAKLFERECKFVIADFILQDEIYTEDIPEFPTYDEIFTLAHYDLVQTEFELAKIFKEPNDFKMNDKDVIYELNKEEGPIHELAIPAHTLSESGVELYRVIDVQKSTQYITVLKSYLGSKERGQWNLTNSIAVTKIRTKS